MIFKLFTIFTFNLFIGYISAGGGGGWSQAEPEPIVNILIINTFDQCEGKNGANYTLISLERNDIWCGLNPPNGQSQLVSCLPNQHNQVVQLQQLAGSAWNSGAFVQTEQLWLALTGPLEGRYVYQKVISLSIDYLKKCSSILGYSYVSSKLNTLLIVDQLPLQALISPTGAFDVLKKGCSTICQGRSLIV